MRVLKTIPAVLLNTLSPSRVQHRSMVDLYGPTFLSKPKTKKKYRSGQVVMQSSLRTENIEPPPNPSTLLSEVELKNQVDTVMMIYTCRGYLLEIFRASTNILVYRCPCSIHLCLYRGVAFGLVGRKTKRFVHNRSWTKY